MSGNGSDRRWLRLYSEMPFSLKARKLPDRLFRALIQCWAIYSWEGCLMPSDLHTMRGGDLEEAESLITELVVRRWLDKCSDGGYKPHDWDEHQPAATTSTRRVRAWRQLKGKPMELHAKLSEFVVIDQDAAETLWRDCVAADPAVRVADLAAWARARLPIARPTNPVGFLLVVLPREVAKFAEAREANAAAERNAARRRAELMGDGHWESEIGEQ